MKVFLSGPSEGRHCKYQSSQRKSNSAQLVFQVSFSMMSSRAQSQRNPVVTWLLFCLTDSCMSHGNSCVLETEVDHVYFCFIILKLISS